MKKIKIHSKFRIAIPAIIMGAVIFGITAPTYAHALLGIEMAVARGIFSVLSEILHTVLNWLVLAGAAFLEGMLDVGFTKNINTITEGWKMARDISNMFFILIMVIIAFATILRSEKYGVKKLLPKVIGVALLINFSMVLCGIIIDFSNITGEFFIKDLRQNTQTKKGAISASFVDAFKLGSTNVTFTNCADYKKLAIDICNKQPIGLQNSCLSNAESNYNTCLTSGKVDVPGPEQDFLTVMLSATVGSIIMLIAAFTLFAGGIMLLIRVVAIWLLVVISPLAFMCYIMPGLDSNWKKWWSKFINYCIFAPVYAFFIWMAVKFAQNSAASRIAAAANPPTGSWSSLSTMYTIDPGQMLISYLIMVALLIGGIIVAQQLGIAGSKTVMKIATNAKNGATAWAKRKTTGMAKEYGTKGAGAITQKFGSVLKNVPGFKGTGRRMESSGKMLKQKSAEGKELEAYKKRLALMTKEDMMAEIKMKHLRPSFRLAAVQKASERGDLAKTTDREGLKLSTKVLKGYGFAKEAIDLTDSRPDVSDEIKKTVSGVLSKGEQNKWREAAFELEEGKEIISAMMDYSGDSIKKFEEDFNKLNGLAKKKALETMQKMFDGKPLDEITTKTRERYAAITGKLDEAFKDAESLAERYIQGLDAKGFAELENKESKGMAGKYMTEKQVYGVGLSVTSGGDKNIIMEAARNNKNKSVYATMETSELWGSRKTKSATQSTQPAESSFDKDAEQRRKQQGWDK